MVDVVLRRRIKMDIFEVTSLANDIRSLNETGSPNFILCPDCGLKMFSVTDINLVASYKKINPLYLAGFKCVNSHYIFAIKYFNDNDVLSCVVCNRQMMVRDICSLSWYFERLWYASNAWFDESPIRTISEISVMSIFMVTYDIHYNFVIDDLYNVYCPKCGYLKREDFERERNDKELKKRQSDHLDKIIEETN
jgi:rubredoxin